MDTRWEGEEEDVRIAAARGSLCDVPLEFVGEVARARAMAEASDVEGGAAARHGDGRGQRICFNRPKA